MTKIWYPVKTEFLPFTCEDITVVMTTSVSANWKSPSHHRERSRLFHSQISHLEKQDGFSNQLPNFDINIFDDVENEGIDGRFVPMTDSEVDNLTETGETANTKRKILYDINFVKQFLTEHGERRSIEEITAVDLNNYLSKFIFAARTKKDEKREPSSHRGILSSVECHLRRACYLLLCRQIYYQRQRFSKDTSDALKAKPKELKRQGKGNKPKATTA